MQTQGREGMQVLSVDKKGFITALENMKWAGLPKFLDGINNLGAD